MGRAVRRQLDPLDRPAFGIGQVLLGEAGEEFDNIRCGLPVGEIVDLGPIARRIGGNIVLQRNRDVDQLAQHACGLSLASFCIGLGLIYPSTPAHDALTENQQLTFGSSSCRPTGLRARRSTIPSSTRNTLTWCRASSPSSAVRC